MGIPSRTSIDKKDLGWQCHNCRCHLVKAKDLIPGEFTGRMGDAVFVSSVINIEREQPETQLMRSGEYLVQYVNCKFCHQYLGWTYLKSYGKRYRYKEGKFCLELHQIRPRGIRVCTF